MPLAKQPPLQHGSTPEANKFTHNITKINLAPIDTRDTRETKNT